MKRIILLVVLLLVGVIFAGCDITYEIQKDNSVIVTLECDEDDVDDFGKEFKFDEGDLDDEEDVEDALDDVLDKYDDFEGDISVKDFKRDKNDNFKIVFLYVPTDEYDDAVENGESAVTIAEDLLDAFAEDQYDDQFEDVYDKEFSEAVDDEDVYVYDGNGDELNDKEMENYFEKANLEKLNATLIFLPSLIDYKDVEITVPGKVELMIGDEDVEIDDGVITIESPTMIIYKTSGSPLVAILVVILLAALGVAGYFAYEKKWFDKIFKKGSTDEFDSEVVEAE
ncbi:MAG: hypothetical protein AB1Z23_08150 [Eubacteriales bacterium]